MWAVERVKESRPNLGLMSSYTERNPIGHRTQSDQTADANGNYFLHFAPLCQPSSTKKATNN